MDLDDFLVVPVTVKSVLLKQTLVGVCLMISMTVGAFEYMWAPFIFLGFEAR